MEVITINDVRNPKISIIIPTLNEEKYIKRCLFSLRDQEFDEEYEIIIGDSFSSDRTVEIAKEYADKIVLIEKKGNASYGRNAGASVSKGDILVFLDADTYSSRNLLYEISKAFEDEEVIAATGPVFFDHKKYISKQYFAIDFYKFLMKIGKPFFSGVFTVIRRDVFFRIGGWPEDIFPGEEIEFSKRIWEEEGRFEWLDDVFILASSRRLKKFGFLGMIKRYWERYLRSKKYKRPEKWEIVR